MTRGIGAGGYSGPGMLLTEDPNTIEYVTDESVSNPETRFSIVCDAIANDRSHASEATSQFLNTLYDNLAIFKLDQHGDDPLDERVVSALDQMKPLRDYFLEFVRVVCQSERGAQIHPVIRSFLGRSLVFKQAPRDVVHFNHLWCDHHRFLLRELFLGVIALLIRNQRFDEVNAYLAADYRFKTDRGPQTVSFLAFDAYVKSLDEFRMRRMRKKRFSAAADFMRERSDREYLAFDDIMQADLVLCVRGLLHHTGALTRWVPRTLVHAENYEEAGFDIFCAGKSRKNFDPVAKALKVKSRSDLQKRFAKVSEQCRLNEWTFGASALPFEMYMAFD